MGNEDTAFNIRIRLPDESVAASDDQRRAFWDWIREEGSSHYNEMSSVSFEAELRRSFGRKLHHFLVEHFHEGWLGSMEGTRVERSVTVSAPEEAKLLPLVFFEVRKLTYGSLELGIEVTGAKHLAKLFDNNFDIFAAFLHTYVPAAFKTSIGGQSPHISAYEAIVNELRFDVLAGPGLHHSFTESPTAPLGNSSHLAPTKAHAVWLIANASLVVPVILALSVCLVAFRGTTEQSERLAAAEMQVYENQKALVTSLAERVSELENLNRELVMTLRGKETPTVGEGRAEGADDG